MVNTRVGQEAERMGENVARVLIVVSLDITGKDRQMGLGLATLGHVLGFRGSRCCFQWSDIVLEVMGSNQEERPNVGDGWDVSSKWMDFL